MSSKWKSFITIERIPFFFADGDEDEEEYINFVVIDEFHEKFGPAASWTPLYAPDKHLSASQQINVESI